MLFQIYHFQAQHHDGVTTTVKHACSQAKKVVLLSKCGQGIEVTQPLQRIVHAGSARLSTQSMFQL